jgi:hypothetical protein
MSRPYVAWVQIRCLVRSVRPESFHSFRCTRALPAKARWPPKVKCISRSDHRLSGKRLSTLFGYVPPGGSRRATKAGRCAQSWRKEPFRLSKPAKRAPRRPHRCAFTSYTGVGGLMRRFLCHRRRILVPTMSKLGASVPSQSLERVHGICPPFSKYTDRGNTEGLVRRGIRASPL